MKNTFLILVLIFFCLNLKGQQKKDVYFLLKRGHYEKSEVIKTTTIQTTRLDSIYSFTLPCKCNSAGYVGFYRGVNPEVGVVNIPVKKIKSKDLKRINFLSFDELVGIMKANDNDFNKKYNLFFVEPGKVNYVYHVFKSTLFADDANDRIDQ